MKIHHKSKRAAPPVSPESPGASLGAHHLAPFMQHPLVAELITQLVNTSTEDLPEVLSKIDVWKWPRSDLNAWIKVLNKFDAILEDVIRDHDIDKLQIRPFSPITKQTVCEILRFERLLLENSTNRKMFNSYDVSYRCRCAILSTLIRSISDSD